MMTWLPCIVPGVVLGFGLNEYGPLWPTARNGCTEKAAAFLVGSRPVVKKPRNLYLHREFPTLGERLPHVFFLFFSFFFSFSFYDSPHPPLLSRLLIVLVRLLVPFPPPPLVLPLTLLLRLLLLLLLRLSLLCLVAD